jgi:hypothetical protein
VFDTRADGLGQSSEEMGTGGRELIATDKSSVTAKPFLHAILVENYQRN